MNRRAFLGGLVATATMAEAGALAEFMDWLRRKPKTTIGPFRKDMPVHYDAYFLAHTDLFQVNDIVHLPNGKQYRIIDTSHGGIIGRAYGFEWYEPS
jgi:hypothetical protein